MAASLKTQRAFVDEVPRLLKSHGWSVRQLARAAGVSDAHLSRVLRGVNYKRASGDLARRVALALGLPEDYFPEYREAFVIDRIRTTSSLREQLYKRLRR